MEIDPQKARQKAFADEERDHYGNLEVCAIVIHEATRVLETLDGQEIPSWEELTDEQRADRVAGVRYIVDHPAAPQDAQHKAWLARNAFRLGADDPRRKPLESLGYLANLKVKLARHIVHAFMD